MTPLYTGDGFFAYRTRRMEFDAAQAFAACVHANASRFTQVEVVHDDRAKGARSWFVKFRPVNPDSLAAIADRENGARQERSTREGAAYVYILDVRSPASVYHCLNPLSGETYELDSSTCSCPDFRYRCGKAPGFGVYCKHQHEMARRFESGELVRLAEAHKSEDYQSDRGGGVYGIRDYHPAEVAAMVARSMNASQGVSA